MTSHTRRVSRALPTHSINETSSTVAPRFLVGPIDEFGLGAAESVPHRHEFTEIVYVTSGAGTHTVDLDTFPIVPPQLFVIAPGQVHHWNATAPIAGTLVLFRDDFLLGLDAPRVEPGAILRPTAERLVCVERLLEGMRDEFGHPDPSHELALRNLLSLLLIECRRMSDGTGPARPSGLAREFLHAVTSEVSATRTVGEIAARLSVTPGHLYEVVVAQTGRTPGELLREVTLLEAQRLLARTTLSCAQVATELGFEDASYFSRFFRREAGVTPTEFRAVHASAA